MSQVVGLDMVTGMGFIGLEPGRLYKMRRGPKLKNQSASGNPLLLNSAAAPFTGLTLYGWSKQEGTPSPDNPVPIVSAGNNGQIGVTAQGGNLVDIASVSAGIGNIAVVVNIPFTVTISANEVDLVISKPNIWRFRFKFEDGTFVYAIDGQLPKTIAATPENKIVEILYRDVYIESGRYQNIMLNAGTAALPYEPYKQPQSLTVSTPGGLPGIPVTVSRLPEGVEPTYVDDSGQAWICDEVDFERGVYVRRVWKATFDGSENWNEYSNYNGFFVSALPEAMSSREGIANQLNVIVDSPSTHDNNARFGASNQYFYIVNVPFSDSSLPDFGLSNWKAHLAAHPLEVMTYLTTATEEPLTAEEIAAYKALRTYSPTTTVSNDADVRMGVGYKK